MQIIFLQYVRYKTYLIPTIYNWITTNELRSSTLKSQIYVIFLVLILIIPYIILDLKYIATKATSPLDR